MLVYQRVDPENNPFLMETNLPSPMTARVELLIYQRVYTIIVLIQDKKELEKYDHR